MARIETAHIGNSYFKHVNVCFPVGIGCINLKDDVMLIQSLFRIINYNPGYQQVFGLLSKNLPQPDGVFNERTLWTIQTFQINMRHRLLSADGKIESAQYKNRHLRNVNNNSRLMTITLLNFMVLDGSLFQYNGIDTVSAVKLESPDILFNCGAG